MSYLSATEEAIEAKREEVYSIRLAKVSSLDNTGKPYVTFYGETTPSQKSYKHIAGYKPVVGDIVALMRQAKTYIILGKVTDEFSAEGEYASKQSVDDIINGTTKVKSAVAADSATKAGSADSATKATNDKNGKDITTEYSKSNHNHDGTYSPTNHNHDGTYSKTNHIHDQIKASSTSNYLLKVDTSGNLQGNGTNAKLSLGAKNNPFYQLRVERILSTGYYDSTYLDMTGYENSTPVFRPSQNKGWNIGTSAYQFNNVRASQFYQNGTAISTSDRNKKNSIADMADKFISFFKKLRPVTFKFNDGESGRLHAGFIAQEVEQAMHSCYINNMEFAGLIIQEDGSYGLRYDEFIAVQTAVIQDLLKRVEILENKQKEGMTHECN